MRNIEEVIMYIEENIDNKENLLNMVKLLDDEKCEYYSDFFDITRYILNLSHDLEHINEVKYEFIKTLINKKNVRYILYILSRNMLSFGESMFYNYSKESVITLLEEDDITKFIYNTINVGNGFWTKQYIYDLEDILKSIIAMDNFNFYHKRILEKNFDNKLLNKIYNENHFNQQEIYKMYANDEKVLEYFYF